MMFLFQSCFYFDVERKYMRKALDKFAHFFVGPLLLKDCVDREIQAVDSGMYNCFTQFTPSIWIDR